MGQSVEIVKTAGYIRLVSDSKNFNVCLYPFFLLSNNHRQANHVLREACSFGHVLQEVCFEEKNDTQAGLHTKDKLGVLM